MGLLACFSNIIVKTRINSHSEKGYSERARGKKGKIKKSPTGKKKSKFYMINSLIIFVTFSLVCVM